MLLSIVFIILALYALLVESNLVSINVVNILDDDLARIFHKMKVVHISDLHITSIGNREKRLIDMLNQMEADWLFITGDFLTNGRDEESCLEVLRQIKKPSHGVWVVLGNADRSKSDESNLGMMRFARRLKELGIKVLRNTSESLAVGDNGDRIFIVGVEGSYLSRSKLSWLLNEIPSCSPIIMLSHYPDILEKRADALVINLEDEEGKGVRGWGWQDNAFFEHDSGLVCFEKDGQHRLRVQRREDGVAIERICLFPVTHQTTNPAFPFADQLDSIDGLQAPPDLEDSAVITIQAKDIPDSNIFGSWQKVWDSTAEVNPVLKDISDSDFKNEFPLLEPDNYFEATFYAKAGVYYHVLAKMKADNDLIANDSVYLQFNDSIGPDKEPIFRIGELGTRRGLSKINLILAGHSHGGQIRLPLLGAPIIIPKHKITHDMGLFYLDGTQMYVNRGIGTVMLPMRFLCSPEITLFQFSDKVSK